MWFNVYVGENLRLCWENRQGEQEIGPLIQYTLGIAMEIKHKSTNPLKNVEILKVENILNKRVYMKSWKC